MKESAILRPEAEGKSRDASEILHSEAYRRELLQRILRSTPFAKSERLGALLTYLCEMSFKGNADKLNEQRIGRFVFGRAEDYDSSADGIVRSQASRLRQRLDQYFAAEGQGEPLQISIPRGSYAPLFAERKVPPQELEHQPLDPTIGATDDQSQKPPPVVLTPATGKLSRALLWLLVALLSAAVWLLWLRSNRVQTEGKVPRAEDPVLQRFWTGVFTPGLTTLVVTPDSGLVMYEYFSGTRVDLKSYLDGKYRAGINETAPSETPLIQRAPMLDLANRRYTSIVDVEAILHMKERARISNSDIQVRFARDLRPNDLKTGNVILLGASTADPWVELFEKDMNFVLQDDYTRDRAVLNRSPLKTEPERWSFPHGNPNREVFGIVAYRPNLAGNGSALILEGTSMSGTEAATDFIMDDAQIVPFLKQIGSTKEHVPHFEVALTTNNLGASAGRPRILAWRKLSD